VLGLVAVVGVVVQLGFDVDVIAGIAFVVVLAVISAIDLEQLRVPDRIVLPASAGALLWQVAFHRSDLKECLIAGAVGGVFFAITSILSRGAVGMGDAKLALLIGLTLGYGAISAVFLATIIGAVAAAVVLWRGGTDARKTPIAYAPFLAAGAAAALVFGVASPLT